MAVFFQFLMRQVLRSVTKESKRISAVAGYLPHHIGDSYRPFYHSRQESIRKGRPSLDESAAP